jgi:coenzyme F420-reducing hydrogenase gamma subunit
MTVERCQLLGRVGADCELLVGEAEARDERPVHQPLCPDAPIPGGPWHYAGCDPDGARVNANGVCEGCGGIACPECGLEVCDCEGRTA